MLLPVARLRVRLDPAILALGLTVEGLLRQATRFGRPRMGLDGDRAWINIHGGISQTTRAGDFSDLLQAFQDWVAEELGRGEAANEKLRLKFLLLLEGHGSHYAPLQERYNCGICYKPCSPLEQPMAGVRHDGTGRPQRVAACACRRTAAAQPSQ